MKKKLLSRAGLLLLALTLWQNIQAQCLLKPVLLNERIAASSLVVEGTVVAKQAFWDANHTMIYTLNTIELYKVFKGAVTTTYVNIITEGGTIGFDRIKADPSLELEIGEVGIFTCSSNMYPNSGYANNTYPSYTCYGGMQGFIKYLPEQNIATEPFQTYNDVENVLFQKITNATQQSIKTIKQYSFTAAATNSTTFKVMAPTIAGFSPTTITAGTKSQLTITGSGFGSTQGAGTVGFKNADDGGATYINPLATQYISWTDNQIVVEVPDEAGTGTIQVTQGSAATSSGTLTISYAQLNVSSSGTAYQPDHVNDNGSGGYTWQMNTAFDANASAKASFLRAFETWRCGTGINWTIGSTTSVDDNLSDNINVITFDDNSPLNSGVLGTCYTYWTACSASGTLKWYVRELDIIFDNGSNITPLTWEYGPSAPSGSEYDFETVALHELGHGHQLGHVISPGAVMHYSISNGTANRSLGVNDDAAGDYVQSQSIVSNGCGSGAMTNYTCTSSTATQLAAGSCGITATTIGQEIFCNAVSGASNYEYEFTNTSLGFTQIVQRSSGLTNFFMSWVSGLQSATTYNVRVRAYVAGSWGSFGTICTITTPTVVVSTTQLAAGSCGITATTIGQEIFCNAVSGASNYEYEFTNVGLGFSRTVQRSSGLTNFFMSWVSGLQNATTYNVRVRAYVSGSWGTFGTVCTITTPTVVVASTQLAAGSCGITASSIGQEIFCNAVSGASNYEYEFTNVGLGFSRTVQRSSGLTNFFMHWISGLQYATTYNVRVRAYANGTWGSFNTVCTITTPALVIPSTQLAGGSCGIVASSSNQQIFCDAVSGASNYEYRFVNSGLGFSQTIQRSSGLNNFYLRWVNGLQQGITYDVTVRAYLGGSWGSYGAVCTITTTGGYALVKDLFTAPTTAVVNNSSLSIYPNPLNKENSLNVGINITDETETIGMLKIYGVLGNEIINQQVLINSTISVELPKDILSGIYFIEVATKNKKQVQKLIIK